MSTFVDIKRIISNTDKTTAIRLDDDLKITIRTEKSGVHTDHQADFSNLQEGQSIPTTNPIGWVQVTKDGSQEIGMIGVNVYHAEDEHDTVPEEGLYWYNPSTNYWPSTAAQAGKTIAPNPSFQDPYPVQSFPTVIFNISTAGALPAQNNVNTTPIPSTEIISNRRSILKRNLNMIISDPMLPAIIGLTSFAVINDLRIPVQSSQITLENDYPRRLQSFWTYLEMLTRAISIDSNISDDQKFALLNGETSISPWDIFEQIPRDTAQRIRGVASRDGWTFNHFGSVARANPQSAWVYTAPSSPWSRTVDSTFNIGSTSPVTQYNWITWLRR